MALWPSPSALSAKHAPLPLGAMSSGAARFLLLSLAFAAAIHLLHDVIFVHPQLQPAALPSGCPAAIGTPATAPNEQLTPPPLPPVLRVFMYAMPREFNVGLLDVYWGSAHTGGQERGGRGGRKKGRKGRRRGAGGGGGASGRRLLSATGDEEGGGQAASSSASSSDGSSGPSGAAPHASAAAWFSAGSPSSAPALSYPRHQHAAEWFLFSFLSRLPVLPANASARQQQQALAACAPPQLPLLPPAASICVLRVGSAAQADLVFVPLFSSLLLKAERVSGGRVSAAEVERRAVRWVASQPGWQASRGRDHVWPAGHPRALIAGALPLLSNASAGALPPVLLVSDFGRVAGGGRSGVANAVKDVVLPYMHRVEPLGGGGEEEEEERPTLLYFRGNIHRKAAGHLREALFSQLLRQPGVVMEEGAQTSSGVRAAQRGMRMARFCLHPEGDTPSSGRLFDAIVSGCVPVVVSDWLDLPFEDALDYSEFCVFVDSHEATQPDHLLSILRREVASGGWQAKRRRLREVQPLFVYEAPAEGGAARGGAETEGAATDVAAAALAVPAIWRKLATKVPWIREEVRRVRRRTFPGFGPCSCGCTYEQH